MHTNMEDPSVASRSEKLPPVDLIINCYEGTYRNVLSPGYFSGVARDNRFSFARKVVLLHNIEDMREACCLAKDRKAEGEIDEFVLVEDLLEQALRTTGLRREELGEISYYSNWALVALVVPGSDYIVHWDAEVRMVAPYDWISPSLRLMQSDARVAVANPMWAKGVVEPEARERVGDFVLSFGFSDQVYLLRRAEFARPIYHHWTPISLRYPVAYVAAYFEQMVDSYLRVEKRYRATLMRASFLHPSKEGAFYPGGATNRVLSAGAHLLVGVMRRLPGRHRYLHD